MGKKKPSSDENHIGKPVNCQVKERCPSFSQAQVILNSRVEWSPS